MSAFLAGICFKSDNNICPPGSTVISADLAVVVAFVGIAGIGLLWLVFRSRRG